MRALLLAALVLALPARAEEPADGAGGVMVGRIDPEAFQGDFQAFFEGFQAAVARRDRDAIADLTRFPFVGTGLTVPLPRKERARLVDGRVELDRATFRRLVPRLFDREVRAAVAQGHWTRREVEPPAYRLAVRDLGDCVAWFDLVLDGGAWKLAGIDDSCDD